MRCEIWNVCREEHNVMNTIAKPNYELSPREPNYEL
jgi:hypothetical protein